ncbi:cysteine hydrolase family protein [Ferrimicrobium acidiphilum]|uniref:cysteine hydrolase family protein n=1 Tax=Ferrimicrobium acidiphilum TaxID=121039 RepID=UPI0023F2E661|nr:isochorismatase family protein [Ferrimicrobium acidiphilum]
MSQPIPPSEIWSSYLDDDERDLLSGAGFGRRIGYGERPALLVIDAQRYMLGDAMLGDDELSVYPSSCRETGRSALVHIQALCEAFRRQDCPVIFTQFVLAADGSDAGIYRRKRDLLTVEGWCIEGTHGAQLVEELCSQSGDLILKKLKPSAFAGTPLLGHLIDRKVDDLVVVGGSTSNCVRATVVDAAALNFRVQVCADAVFDRIAVSHAISLFDLDRQYADVVWSSDVLAWLDGIER